MESELLTTLIEEKDMANAATIGFNKKPKKGYKTPAAIGIPAKL